MTPERASAGPFRVVYWNNVPAPYMIDRFNALAARSNLSLEVWFSERTVAERTWRIDETQWRFQYRYLPRVSVGARALALATPLLGRRRPDLLVMQYGALEYVLGWCGAVIRGWRTAFWVEVTFDSWVRRRSHREWLKQRMFSAVDGVMTAGADGAGFARRYGAPADRIHIVRHAVDADFFARRSRLARGGRDELRRTLGTQGTLFLYVGRLWEPKGIFELVEAYARLRADGLAVSLAIVGDGRDEDRLRSTVSHMGLAGVTFAGFKQLEQLPEWYAAADVLVFPTRGDPYGMVVDEAMAAGLPVISTASAGEIGSRVVEGETGLLVPPEDPRALARAMAQLALDPAEARRMGRKAAVRMRGVGPEQWADDFEVALRQVLTSRRRTQSRASAVPPA